MTSNIKIKKINNEVSSIIMDEPKTYNSLSFKNLSDLLKTLKKLDSDKKVKVILVNIFAGINRCDWVAEGIVQALQKIEVNMPLVIRLAGTNVEQGNKILKESNLN